MTVANKFEKLGNRFSPGQHARHSADAAAFLVGDILPGRAVDFSHGDVVAHPPSAESFACFAAAVDAGAAYTLYRGAEEIRTILSGRLADFTGAPVNAKEELIITPGSQGALFLAIAATVAAGDKVAIVQPDYYANRKLVEFFEGEMLPVRMDYVTTSGRAGLDLDQLEDAFRAGARVFLFSNPNNPAGVVYSADEIDAIAALAGRYGVTVIADELYSRLLYAGSTYTHLRARAVDPDQVITIMGPSKTESLSGYRLGIAFGAAQIIERMEKLQGIVSLRAPAYSQAVLRTWFAEPAGWMAARIAAHQAIRDDVLRLFRGIDSCRIRTPDAGSYLFPELPALRIAPADFVTALREQAGVVVTPGTEFSPHAGRNIRLNFSQDREATAAAVTRIAALVERYRA